MNVENLLARLEGAKRIGDNWQAKCPAHPDKNPSLNISLGRDGKILLKCFAGCEFPDIVRALGLKESDFFQAQHNGTRPERRIVATYPYEDEQGKLLFEIVRFDPKDFRVRRPGENGEWIWDLKKTRRVLYKLPEVTQAVQNEETIFVTEGEKDVDSLRKLGPTATTNPGGAGKWRPEFSETLRGANIVVLPDKDEPGLKHAAQVTKSLHGIAASVKLVELPGNGKDASDWIAVGGTKEELLKLVGQAPVWKPTLKQLSEAELEAKIHELPLTDAGNGEMIVLLAGERLRYDHRQKRWLLWTGVRWATDCDGEVDRIALDAARARLRAAASIGNEDLHKATVKWALKSESAYSRRAALEWAGSLKPIADSGEGWDADPWLLGVENGDVDLRIGQFRGGRPEDRITMTTGLAFDPDAQCPRWLAFLEEIFSGDRNLIDYIQRAIGYSLTGDTSEQCLFLCYGTGANGKTVFLTALRSALGDYAANTPFQTFEDIRSQISTNDVAALYGKRLVMSAETKERTRLNEARVKAMTGGDPITARFLFKEFFTFIPHFKIWLAVNHKPTVTDESYGFWRRIRLIPFKAQFPPEKADKHLAGTLKQETPGILAWAVRGCLAWQRQGLEPPEIVTHATSEYQAESDLFGQFLEECCVQERGLWCYAKDLYRTYKEWTEQNSLNSMSSTAFGRRLSERGFQREHRERGKVYLDLGVKAENYSAEGV